MTDSTPCIPELDAVYLDVAGPGLERLGEADAIDWSRASLNGSIVPAKRGGFLDSGCSLICLRPSKDARYRHIDSVFSDTVDWQLIEDHWPDLLQVVLSIKAGTISSAQLLRRLGSYGRRNRLYLAFRELGRVVRTVFLLEYLGDAKLREQITATTNKVEAYNGFAKWLNFCGAGGSTPSTWSSKRSTSAEFGEAP